MEQETKEQEMIRSLQSELQRTRAQLRLQQKAQKVNVNASQAMDSPKETGDRNQVRSGRSDGGGSGSGRPCSCSRCRSHSLRNKGPRQEEQPSRTVDGRNPYLASPSPGFSVSPPGHILSPPPFPGMPTSSLPVAATPVAARGTPSVAAVPEKQNFSSRGTYSSSGSSSFSSADDVPYQKPPSGTFTTVKGVPQPSTWPTGKQHFSAVQDFWKATGSSEASSSSRPPSSNTPGGGNGGTFSHSTSQGGAPRQPLSFSQHPVSNTPPPSATIVNPLPVGAATPIRPTSLPKSSTSPVPSSSYQTSAQAKMPPFLPTSSREPQRSPAEPVFQAPSSATVRGTSHGEYDSRGMRHSPHRFRESPPSTTALQQSPPSPSITTAPPTPQVYTSSPPQAAGVKVVIAPPPRSPSVSSFDSTTSSSSSSPSSVWSTLAPSSASHRDSHEIVASMQPPPPGAAVSSHFLSAPSTSVPIGNPEALARWQARQSELASASSSGRQELKPSSIPPVPQERHTSGSGGKAKPRVAIHSPSSSPSHSVTRNSGIPMNSSTASPAGYARSSSPFCPDCQAHYLQYHQGHHHHPYNASTCSCRPAEPPTSGPLQQVGAIAVRGGEKEEKFVSQSSFTLPPLSVSTHEKRVQPSRGNDALVVYGSSSTNRYTGRPPSHSVECGGHTSLVSSPYVSNDSLRVSGSGRDEAPVKGSSHRHPCCRTGFHHRSSSLKIYPCHHSPHHHGCDHTDVHEHRHHYHPCSDSYTSTTSEENSARVEKHIERREVSGPPFRSLPSSPSTVPSPIALSEESKLLQSQSNFSSQMVMRYPSLKKTSPVASFPPPSSAFLPPIATFAGVQSGSPSSNSPLSHSFAASMVDQAHQQHLRNAKRALALAHEELGQAREKRMQLATQVQEWE